MAKVKLDKATKEWLATHPCTETTVWQCSKCGMWFKPTLGHKCKKEKKDG